MPAIHAGRVYPAKADCYSVGQFQMQALYLLGQGVRWGVMAERCGMRKPIRRRQGEQPYITGDSGHLKMVLGLRPCKAGGRRNSYSLKRTVTYDLAVKLCRGLGIDYHDIGV